MKSFSIIINQNRDGQMAIKVDAVEVDTNEDEAKVADVFEKIIEHTLSRLLQRVNAPPEGGQPEGVIQFPQQNGSTPPNVAKVPTGEEIRRAAEFAQQIDPNQN